VHKWARHEALWVSTLLLQTPLSVLSTRPFVLCATTRRSSTRHAISPSARTNNNLVLTLQHLTRFLLLLFLLVSRFYVSLFSLSSAGRLLYSLSLTTSCFPLPLLLAPAVATRSSLTITNSPLPSAPTWSSVARPASLINYCSTEDKGIYLSPLSCTSEIATPRQLPISKQRGRISRPWHLPSPTVRLRLFFRYRSTRCGLLTFHFQCILMWKML
jgi:hypothetical protein